MHWGGYTIHVDPDDWVEPDMLERLYKKVQKDNADMVFCDFYLKFSPQSFLEYINDGAWVQKNMLRFIIPATV